MLEGCSLLNHSPISCGACVLNLYLADDFVEGGFLIVILDLAAVGLAGLWRLDRIEVVRVLLILHEIINFIGGVKFIFKYKYDH